MFQKKAEGSLHDGVSPVSNVIHIPQPIERTTAGLRDFLFHELDAFVRGSTTPERIRSVTQVANAIVDSARLELEFARLVKTRGKGMKTGMPRPVRLVKRNALRKIMPVPEPLPVAKKRVQPIPVRIVKSRSRRKR